MIARGAYTLHTILSFNSGFLTNVLSFERTTNFRVMNSGLHSSSEWRSWSTRAQRHGRRLGVNACQCHGVTCHPDSAGRIFSADILFYRSSISSIIVTLYLGCHIMSRTTVFKVPISKSRLRWGPRKVNKIVDEAMGGSKFIVDWFFTTRTSCSRQERARPCALIEFFSF